MSGHVTITSGDLTARIDPLGAELPPGPGLYPRLMRDMAQTLVDCLGSAPG